MHFERTPLPEQLQGAIRRPQRWVRIPPVQFFFEKHFVIELQPLLQLLLVFDLDEVDGSFLVDLV